MWLKRNHCLCIKNGIGGHFWAAILDLKVKMVPELSKSLSVRSVMSNLAGKVASFAFVAHLVQEISLFLVFNVVLAAILDLKVKIVPKHNCYHSIRSVVPKLVGNDISYALLANLIQEISLFLVINMALAAILKNGLSKYFPATFGRCMGAYFSSNRLILSNQSRN